MNGYRTTTTIDQHIGDHHTGMPIMVLRDVTTDLSAYADRPYDDLAADERVWWDDLLAETHAVDVAIERLTADERRAVTDAIEAAGVDCDLENAPAAMLEAARRALGRDLAGRAPAR